MLRVLLQTKTMHLLILFIAVWASGATTLKFYDGSNQYVLERTKDQIFFDSYDSHFTFKFKPCNQASLERFWQQLVRESERLPLVSGKEPKRPHIVFDGKSRLLFPRPPRMLKDVPQAVSLLQVEEARECTKR